MLQVWKTYLAPNRHENHLRVHVTPKSELAEIIPVLNPGLSVRIVASTRTQTRDRKENGGREEFACQRRTSSTASSGRHAATPRTRHGTAINISVTYIYIYRHLTCDTHAVQIDQSIRLMLIR